MKLTYGITSAVVLAALRSTLADPIPEPKTTKRIKTKTKTQKAPATCPNNQVTYTQGSSHYCCPGQVENTGNGQSTYCCVGAASVSASGSASGTASLTCSTTIPISATSYISLAQAAATRLHGSSSSKAGAAAMVTSGPLAGALMAVGGLALAL